MITELELKTRITELEAEMEAHRLAKEIKEGKRKAKRRLFLIDCLSYIQSSDKDTIEQQRRILLVKYATACQRVSDDTGGMSTVRMDPEAKKIYDAACRTHGTDKMKRQLQALNFILK